ncbi:MAG: HlyD family secretion protein [Flavipsychrobacter sp.]|nr:HlyD family secretion protein [Flavipsychrobacter sp.]
MSVQENKRPDQNQENENHPEEAQKPANPRAGMKIETPRNRDNNDKKKNKNRTYFSNIAVILILLGICLYIVKSYLHIGDNDYTENAQVEEYINPINSRVSAYIKEIRFIEHQPVRRGDTLMILDNREILTQLNQAEAAYSNALAQKNTTGSSVNTATNNISVLEANLAGAKARLWNAEQNLKRYANLLKAEAVTKQQYDQIKTEYDAQEAAYEALVNQKKSASLSTIEVKTRLQINDAEIKRTKAALEMAKLNLSYCTVTAPNDGVMARRMINEGQLLQAGQQVATIVSEPRWVTANLLEKQMPYVKIGTLVSMKADALAGSEFEGKVTAISGATGARYSNVPTDNASGNFIKVQQRIPVRIEFTPKNKKEDLEKLKAGMNMIVRIKN